MPLPLRSGRPWLPALVLVTGVGPLATDTYLASLPQVQRSLGTSSTVVQLTMTSFIVGMAVGQLLSGSVSDSVGRRPMILLGAATFTLTSLVCAVSPSGWSLVAARLAQGVVAGAGVAVGRAVVSDRYDGPRAAAMFGTLASFSLIGPVVAPGIGGALLSVGDWRTIFGFLTVLGALMTALALVGIPETLPPDRRHAGGPRRVTGRMWELATDRVFLAPVAVQCLVTAGFFVYIGGSSIVLQSQLGVTPGQYSVLFSSNAVGMVLASLAFRLLVARTGAAVLRTIALAVTMTAGFALFAICLVAPGHQPPLPMVWAPLAVMLAGLGMFLPASTVVVQRAGRRLAGTAAALGGGVPFLVGALTTPLTGVLGRQTVLTMSTGTAFFYVLAVVVAWRTRRLVPSDRPEAEALGREPDLVGRA